ncbi:hypothetical protein EMIHUDRAFT_241402 [Emiliania huxleyi CCMP1516]|uniref:Uncharacterized protein n=2 Tax=Emiliania huxleyi TaxID=2903 RepID=A0A0D3JCP5_EMIH1|nr:hypothetical protein EMIHUDRAFT_241402 [Emiliania huxleyi CCMP1516]EOD21280.1 hypothetical protein EMIHUDRAFT_241402 [Emiliania huxleyi CCMP1516]|eukprot:XP_005773709.1 hypothetical protein EMIHUDRAFT_241402 [Emiliania huxleyi CCMP1516]
MSLILSVITASAFAPAPAFTFTHVPTPVRLAPRLAPPRAARPCMVDSSGIDGWPELAQAAVFVGSYASLGACAVGTTRLFDAARESALPLITGSRSAAAELHRDFVAALPLLGLLYLAAGVGHFADAEAFRAIYPPVGTWGLWYLPGSAEFHVAWTGVAECLGGGGLALGGLLSGLGVEAEGALGLPVGGLLTAASAGGLFLLTVAVTPANIYMFTHGAVMSGQDAGAALGLSFHCARFGIQVVLLSLLATLARDSFYYAWGDQLD